MLGPHEGDAIPTRLFLYLSEYRARKSGHSLPHRNRWDAIAGQVTLRVCSSNFSARIIILHAETPRGTSVPTEMRCSVLPLLVSLIFGPANPYLHGSGPGFYMIIEAKPNVWVHANFQQSGLLGLTPLFAFQSPSLEDI